MAVLFACPFCRTLYRRGEGPTCAVCGVKLVAFERLPPSAEAIAEVSDSEEPLFPVLPEDEPFPWNDFTRGRGLLLALAALGLVLFFTPWVEIVMPESEVRSGFDLARGRAGWLWGGATSWLVLIPLVWTRRTITALRGVRPISVALSATTLGEVLMLLALPPGGGRIPVQIHWSFGLYASALVSAAAIVVALRLGGSLPPLPETKSGSLESSSDRILH